MMNALRFNRYTLTAIALIAFLAGCGGTQNAMNAPTSVMPQSVAPAAHGKSWMLPKAKSENLIYLTGYDDSSFYTEVYTYRKPHRLVGRLDIWAPTLCSDNHGNVWVPTSDVYGYPNYIYEYAHGGTKPIAVLEESSGHPWGCSVDPTTGNLAVTNYCEDYIDSGDCAGPGFLAIFKNAKGSPIKYYDSNFMQYYFCSYNNIGDLMIDGDGYYNQLYIFGELLKGRTKFRNITLNEQFDQSPGALQWNGSYLSVATDEEQIDEFSIRGDEGKDVVNTPIDAYLTGQFVIFGSKVVVTLYQPRGVGFFDYPSGKQSQKDLDLSGALGITVSVAPSGQRIHK
jgi:hypothetical protein